MEPEALGRLGDSGIVAVDDLLHLFCIADQNDRFTYRAAADAAAVFFNGTDIGSDQVRIDQGSHTIVDENDIAFTPVKTGRLRKAVVDGHLTGLTTRDNGCDLVQTKGIFEFLHVGDPFPDADDHDPVDLRMTVENFNRVHDDRLSVYKKELLGSVLGVHPLAGAARKNDCQIHTCRYDLLFTNTNDENHSRSASFVFFHCRHHTAVSIRKAVNRLPAQRAQFGCIQIHVESGRITQL